MPTNLEALRTSLFKRVLKILCIYVSATLQGVQDLSSLTRDGTCAPAVEAESLNHCTAREFPKVFIRKWLPTPVFLPGESHGWRSLAGYSPWGHKELDTTE